MKGLKMIVLQAIGSWGHISSSVGHNPLNVSVLVQAIVSWNICQKMGSVGCVGYLFLGIVQVICWC